jgi:hypothetical protein
MPLPKTFSSIKVDKDGREFVVHRPSGVRYYLNRTVDPKLRGTSGLSLHPPGEREPAPPRRPQADATQPQPRRAIVARFVKGSAPRRNYADC